MIRRREFITLLGGAAAAWPLAARAQQPRKLPTIGYLSGGGPVQNVQWIAAFTQRLHQLGWIEGRTVEIEYRWGEARMERVSAFAADFVRLKVDVIVTQATQPVILAKQATATIPIVFVATGDPVGSGLVTSLARPGGNVTGLSLQNSEITGKRLEILREAAPRLSRVAVLFDVGNPSNTPVISEFQAAARWGLRLLCSSTGEPMRLRPPSSRSRGVRRRSAFLAVHSQSPTGPKFTPWPWGHDCQRSTTHASMLMREGLCPTDQTSRTYTGAPVIMSTRFCAGRSLPTSQWSNLRSLIWSLISRPRRRSASKFRPRSSPAPTR